jgi:hypothetical protein
MLLRMRIIFSTPSSPRAMRVEGGELKISW